MRNTYDADTNQKKASVVIFIPDKIDFKPNSISRNRDLSKSEMFNLPGKYKNSKFIDT